MSLLSVVLPVRNGENFLAAALDSILAQSYADFTLHVSDNASTDATAAILAAYAARDPRVRPSRSDEPLSQVANMNRAVALADSEWVQMFCHDDLMRPDALERIAGAIARVSGSKVGLIGHGQTYLFPSGLTGPEMSEGGLETLSGHDQLRRLFRSAPGRALPMPAVTTAAVRRAAFLARGGFEEGWVHFDTFCWMEMLLEHDLGFIAAPLTVNRIHGGQVAVAAHRSLRTVKEKRVFYPRFVARHGKALGLKPAAKLVAWASAPSLAAVEMVVNLRTGRWRQAAGVLGALPLPWWPLMPALVARSWRSEGARQVRVNPHLTAAEFYGRG